MTTLFKAITRTSPKAINENNGQAISIRQAPVRAVAESYTRLIIRDLIVGNPALCVNLTASVIKSKNWADKNTVRCEDLIATITGIQSLSSDLEMLAERIATECLSYQAVRDVTIRVEKRNVDGSYTALGVEIFRQQ